MSRFATKSKATRNAAKKSSGDGVKRFKMEKRVVELFILGPLNEWEEQGKAALFETHIHQLWVNGKNGARGRFISRYGAPAKGEEDRLASIGWKLRDKYKESTNEKKKNFFRDWLPTSQTHVNVLDVDDLSRGPLVYSMPGSVATFVKEEFNDLTDPEDISEITDFDDGKILEVKHNDKSGFSRRYRVAWSPDAPDLLQRGEINEAVENKIADELYDLTKLQPAYDPDGEEKLFEYLKKKASSLGISLDDLDGDDDDFEDDDEFEEKEDGNDDGFEDEDESTDDDSTDDDEKDIDLEEDEEEEETPKKKPRKRRSETEVPEKAETRRKRRK